MELDLENPLTCFEDAQHSALFLTESDHMLSPDYPATLRATDFDASARTQVVSLISQLSCNFDPLLNYLTVNYLDRFLSRQGIPLSKPWVMKLLAISCVSLASKMLKTQFTLSDFQGDGGFIFDTQTIQRMEMLILGALKWRMRSVTPFSFLSFFTSLFKLKDPPLLQALRARATEIIFMAQNDLKLLEFKPSVVAASALLSASHELFPLQFPCFKKSISNCSFVNKEKMLLCFETVEETLMDGYSWSSVTPVNVLDLQFSSCCGESERTRKSTTTITTVTATATESSRDAKRRKISGSEARRFGFLRTQRY